MATPRQVRRALQLVTTAAVSDLRAVATEAERTGSPTAVRAALFAATPLIIHDYIDGAAAIALDWYEAVRDAARPSHHFTPTPLTVVDDDLIKTTVALATEALHDVEQDIARLTDQMLAEATAESVKLLERSVQMDIASGLRDTVTENVRRDPDAVGWRRFARPEACKFCKMLADRGAVYTESTARFAAHGPIMSGGRKGGACMCIAGPAFGGKEIWAEATPMQYVASQQKRTPEQQAALRDYLNKNYPDAPG